jgi:hypothetical protein
LIKAQLVCTYHPSAGRLLDAFAPVQLDPQHDVGQFHCIKQNQKKRRDDVVYQLNRVGQNKVPEMGQLSLPKAIGPKAIGM